MKKKQIKKPPPKKKVIKKKPLKKKNGLNMKDGVPIPITSPEYRRKAHDPREAIKSYKALHSDRRPKDYIEETVFYRKGKIIKTEYHHATWSIVLTLAILNAVAVFCTKIVIFEEIGKPDVSVFTPSDERLVHKSAGENESEDVD